MAILNFWHCQTFVSVYLQPEKRYDGCVWTSARHRTTTVFEPWTKISPHLVIFRLRAQKLHSVKSPLEVFKNKLVIITTEGTLSVYADITENSSSLLHLFTFFYFLQKRWAHVCFFLTWTKITQTAGFNFAERWIYNCTHATWIDGIALY